MSKESFSWAEFLVSKSLSEIKDAIKENEKVKVMIKEDLSGLKVTLKRSSGESISQSKIDYDKCKNCGYGENHRSSNSDSFKCNNCLEIVELGNPMEEAFEHIQSLIYCLSNTGVKILLDRDSFLEVFPLYDQQYLD